ncbi:glutamine--fructose-6-phosphate aminotransferase [PVC group bacterium (ex Bugula neritina AB1)]|nr:glutamine--fructose-6-phosphate aminotransferase [PVC group bacterium (ex Bugula neritina AB1)]
MCGITGYVGSRQVAPILVEALGYLEYRGYDSAGIAVLHDNKIDISRSIGKVSSLKFLVQQKKVEGQIGLGHTRWATHGQPSEKNAHPHSDCHGKIVVVHNGIIDGHMELKKVLENEGHIFSSQTDSEVLAHLIEKYYDGDLSVAVGKVLKNILGSYSLGVMHVDHPGLLVVARHQSPLLVGCGDNENFISSDIRAILSQTRRIIFLEDQEMASLTAKDIHIETIDGKKIDRKPHFVEESLEQSEKNGYDHFMLKEIFEQPTAIKRTLESRVFEDKKSGLLSVDMGFDEEEIKNIKNIVIVSCGTSWHAGLIARRYIEKLCKIPVSVEYAAEFRYNEPLIDRKTLVIGISQSGETADTLAAIREAKKYGSRIIALCNVVGSSLSREADRTIYTYAGPEIGVASTKAFTCQLTLLYLLALDLAYKNKQMDGDEVSKCIMKIQGITASIEKSLSTENLDKIKHISCKYSQSRNFLYLGRGSGFAIALEGALKLKEISYIHAEGYHAGEMKHGPIALIDKNMPVVVLALKGRRYDKILANIAEIKARDGKVIAIATEGDDAIVELTDEVIYVPDVDRFMTPLVAVIPLQLLSYYIAFQRNCDVDQPRNLAKSVTVE